MMGKERKKEEERSYLLIESYVREQREGIYRFDINFQKKENSKQGREWLLIDNPINNRISSFELYPIIRTRSINPHRKWREEPYEEFMRVCETTWLFHSPKKEKKSNISTVAGGETWHSRAAPLRFSGENCSREYIPRGCRGGHASNRWQISSLDLYVDFSYKVRSKRYAPLHTTGSFACNAGECICTRPTCGRADDA